ncbi:hypothetical protein PG984_011276 [Apiospora sp. TS-2023a]
MDAATAAKSEAETKLEELTPLAIAGLSAADSLKQESLTPALPATLAVEDLSTRLDRSTTLGCTPLEFDMSPGSRSGSRPKTC